MLGLTTSTTIHKTLDLVHIFWGQARLRVEESGSITLIYQTSEAFQHIYVGASLQRFQGTDINGSESYQLQKEEIHGSMCTLVS